MEKYLKDIEPGTAVGSVEELHTWGIVPMQELVTILDEAIEDCLEGEREGPVTARFMFVVYSMRSVLDAMDTAIFKFVDWQMKLEKAVTDTSGKSGLDKQQIRRMFAEPDYKPVEASPVVQFMDKARIEDINDWIIYLEKIGHDVTFGRFSQIVRDAYEPERTEPQEKTPGQTESQEPGA